MFFFWCSETMAAKFGKNLRPVNLTLSSLDTFLTSQYLVICICKICYNYISENFTSCMWNILSTFSNLNMKVRHRNKIPLWSREMKKHIHEFHIVDLIKYVTFKFFKIFFGHRYNYICFISWGSTRPLLKL